MVDVNLGGLGVNLDCEVYESNVYALVYKVVMYASDMPGVAFGGVSDIG